MAGRITFADGQAPAALQMNALLQSGDAIDGSIIGQNTPAAGTFTTLTVVGSAVVPTVATTDSSTKVATTAFVKNALAGAGTYIPGSVKITGGSIDGTTIGATSSAAINGTAGTFASLTVTGNTIFVTQASTDSSTKAATTAFVQAVVSNVSGGGGTGTGGASGAASIKSGTIDGTTIGANSPASGNFTTLSASGATSFLTKPTSDNSTSAATTAFVQAVVSNSGSINPASVAFTGGTINGVTIGGTAPAPATVSNLTFTGALVNNARSVTAAGNITCSATDHVIFVAKTTPAATQVTLPSSPALGRHIRVVDANGVAAANNITVVPASGTINGQANVVMNINYDSYDFEYNGASWNVV